MRIFYSVKLPEGNTDIETKEVDSIDVVSSKYIISLRLSGIQIRDKITKEEIKLQDEDIIFDGNLDLT